MAASGSDLVEAALDAGKAQAAQDADWEAVRASSEIQFTPLPPMKVPEVPGWLEWLEKALGWLFGPVAQGFVTAWPAIEWLLIGAGVLLAAVLVWHLLRLAATRRRRAQPGTWTPEREDALALLEDADRLAAAGRFEEATHLLLERSVGQIRKASPGALVPATTAREIANLPQLPMAARNAFAVMADRVERCLFALRRLDAEDWTAARAAYAQFALAELRR